MFMVLVCFTVIRLGCVSDYAIVVGWCSVSDCVISVIVGDYAVCGVECCGYLESVAMVCTGF